MLKNADGSPHPVKQSQSTQQTKPIAILGAGAWGTALALYLARQGQTVRLWSIEPAEIAAMVSERANNRFLPGFPLPENIEPTADLAHAIEKTDDILLVIPSVGFRHTLTLLKPLLQPHSRLICATKGLDTNTGQLLSDIVEEVLGTTHPFAMLSGPSFAREVASGLPAAVVIASHHDAFLKTLIQRFDSDLFHIDSSDDVIGVEIGGVVKNVIAIATGIADGMQLGANARSAIITRGLAEITQLGLALGAKPDTFLGLSGLGDLILTCSDNQSRNRRLGLAIGEGKNIEQAEQAIGQVVEGKRNAELVVMLAKRHQVSMPICEAIWQILQGNADAKKIVPHLFV